MSDFRIPTINVTLLDYKENATPNSNSLEPSLLVQKELPKVRANKPKVRFKEPLEVFKKQPHDLAQTVPLFSDPSTAATAGLTQRKRKLERTVSVHDFSKEDLVLKALKKSKIIPEFEKGTVKP